MARQVPAHEANTHTHTLPWGGGGLMFCWRRLRRLLTQSPTYGEGGRAKGRAAPGHWPSLLPGTKDWRDCSVARPPGAGPPPALARGAACGGQTPTPSHRAADCSAGADALWQRQGRVRQRQGWEGPHEGPAQDLPLQTPPPAWPALPSPPAWTRWGAEEEVLREAASAFAGGQKEGLQQAAGGGRGATESLGSRLSRPPKWAGPAAPPLPSNRPRPPQPEQPPPFAAAGGLSLRSDQARPPAPPAARPARVPLGWKVSMVPQAGPAHRTSVTRPGQRSYWLRPRVAFRDAVGKRKKKPALRASSIGRGLCGRLDRSAGREGRARKARQGGPRHWLGRRRAVAIRCRVTGGAPPACARLPVPARAALGAAALAALPLPGPAFEQQRRDAVAAGAAAGLGAARPAGGAGGGAGGARDPGAAQLGRRRLLLRAPLRVRARGDRRAGQAPRGWVGAAGGAEPRRGRAAPSPPLSSDRPAGSGAALAGRGRGGGLALPSPSQRASRRARLCFCRARAPARGSPAFPALVLHGLCCQHVGPCAGRSASGETCPPLPGLLRGEEFPLRGNGEAPCFACFAVLLPGPPISGSQTP